MSILNKFIKDEFENPHILISISNSNMIHIKNTLDKSHILNELIPTPKGFGEICTTAIKFNKKDKEKIEGLLEDKKIYYEGIHSLENRYKYNLSKAIDMEIPEKMKMILRKVSSNINLNKEDIIYVLESKDDNEYKSLIKAADIIRSECVGDRIEVRAAIEFSNYCMKNCNYCGLRKDNKQFRYRMSREEILNEVDKLYKLGIKTVILQSGEDPFYTTDIILSIIKEIKEKYKMGITLSIGERKEEEYKLFKKAGINNYLLKIETASKELYDYIHPDSKLDERIKNTQWIKNSGIRIGSGGMIGLPTQTYSDIADVILFQKNYGVHMIGFGPFIPSKSTPFENEKSSDLKLNLKVIALTRIICQDVFLPATTAISTLKKEAQALALMAGANTIMLISTPDKLKEKYSIYSNKKMVDLSFTIESTKEAKRKLPKYLNYDYIKKLGYEIDNDLK
ncbi:MAG: [FeFe] hydrogenase H-cluster radical SAM maturase HydE [Senegalia sp. (in: firmicutes)]|uniref:[FeFe] hydrogenase H-cluster radical SAM maturase HydE n=1 Tax=Senegalia sp. (in: firmicutes) TaxID=1924098 RepID=UPI003F9C781B